MDFGKTIVSEEPQKTTPTGNSFLQLPVMSSGTQLGQVIPPNGNLAPVGYGPVCLQQPTMYDVYQLVAGTKEDVNVHGFGLKGILETQDERWQRMEQQILSIASTMQKLCIDVEQITTHGPVVAVPNPPAEDESESIDRNAADVPFVTVKLPESNSSYTMMISKATEDEFVTCLKPRPLVTKMLKVLHTIPELQTFTLKLTPPKKMSTTDTNVIPAVPRVLIPGRTILLVTAGVLKVFPCKSAKVRNAQSLHKKWKARKGVKVRGYISKTLSYFRRKYRPDGTIISGSDEAESSSETAAAEGSDGSRKRKRSKKNKNSADVDEGDESDDVSCIGASDDEDDDDQ